MVNSLYISKIGSGYQVKGNVDGRTIDIQVINYDAAISSGRLRLEENGGWLKTENLYGALRVAERVSARVPE